MLSDDVVQMQFQYTNPNWPDQLTYVSPGGAITYDPLGNMTSFNGRVFEWQRGRQLAAIREPGLNVEFTYDHTGLRSSKTVNGVTSYYIWAGSLLVARYTPQRDETIAWFYCVNGTMLGFALTIDEETSYYFYVRNLQGDVVAILNAAGEVVAEYVFDAWGNSLHHSGYMATINPITYRGYYWDWATRLFYLQSRYYCPMLRRFISADVYIDTADGILGTNMYAYCHNDPINFWDPNGESRLPPMVLPLQYILNLFNEVHGPRWNTDNAGEAWILGYAGETMTSRTLQSEFGRRMGFAFLGEYHPEFGVITGTIEFSNNGRWYAFDFAVGTADDLRRYSDYLRANMWWADALVEHGKSIPANAHWIERTIQATYGLIGSTRRDRAKAISIREGLDASGATGNQIVFIPTTPVRRRVRIFG